MDEVQRNDPRFVRATYGRIVRDSVATVFDKLRPIGRFPASVIVVLGIKAILVYALVLWINPRGGRPARRA